MNRWTFALPLFSLPLLALLAVSGFTAPKETVVAPAANVDRSPIDIALFSDGRRALTANATADSVSLIDLTAGKVLTEIPVGRRPFDIALRPDGKEALISNTLANTVSVLAINGDKVSVLRIIPVGDEPRGLTYIGGAVNGVAGNKAFVALGGESALAVLDVTAGKTIARYPTDAEPWHITVTPDGKRIIVGCARGRSVNLLSATTGKKEQTIKVVGRNLRHVAVSPDGKWAYVPTIAERMLGVTRPNIDRGWVVGNRLTRVPLETPEDERPTREATTLDTQGNAVADVDGLSIRPDGKQIALTAGGTHELLLMRLTDLPFIAFGGPGDHIDPDVLDDPQRFRRVKLGGRPVGATYTADGKSVAVANYLLNAVQIVDAASGRMIRTIPLGGPSQPSLARRGEAIFLDGDRSFNSWYSCNSCHTEGHTNGGNFDTLNDGGLGKPKKTLSLRGIQYTAPYTWHGWNKDLRQVIHDSLVNTMQGPEPTAEDVAAVEAYLKTLEWKQSPFRNPDGSLTDAAKRGEAVFAAKDCNTCHAAPNYTTPRIATVGLEEKDDFYKGYNPPSLRGVYNRAPYLHDGRARTLEEVLTEYHTPSQLTGKPDCTPTELADMIAFLKSL